MFKCPDKNDSSLSDKKKECDKRSVTCKYSETDFLDSCGGNVHRWQAGQWEPTKTASEINI